MSQEQQGKSQKGKMVLLIVLIGVLVVAAWFALGPKKKGGAPKPKAKPAEASDNTPAAASKSGAAPAGAAAATGEMLMSLPSTEDMKKLTSWFVENDRETLVAKCPNQGVFGLEGSLGALKTNPVPVMVPSEAPFVEPPQLEGVICRRDRRVAVFDGEAYAVGDKIANTAFHIVEVERSAVRLRTEEGRELTLDLLN